MSRIEEAMKRAREAALANAPAVPPADVFTDAWDAAAGEPSGGGVSPVATDVNGDTVEAGDAPGGASQAAVDANAHESHTAAGGPQPAATSAEEVPAGLALFQGFDPRLTEKIVATPDILPVVAEQYRKLAGALHHAQLEKSLKVVMITSAMASEGKTLTSTNLALTFSESYRRSVLLIDADLRRPTLHETFQVPNLSGLGDGLRAESEQKLSLIQVSPRLTLLTAGRPDPDPMSCLTSDRMRRVIEEATTRFDWVLVDTPPVGLLPDARLLAGTVDTTVLVIQAGRTPFALVKRAVEAIGRDRIFGVVLNRAEDLAGPAGYDYYSYYDSYVSRD